MSVLRRALTLDVRSLAACRVVAGLIILVDVMVRAFEFQLFFTERGILPRVAVFETVSPNFPCIHLVSDMWLFQVALFVFHGLAGVALTLGYRTRLTTVVCWYMTHSLMLRNFLVNNGGDAVLVCLLFWAMFLPWGECASLDNLARRDGPDTSREAPPGRSSQRPRSGS